MGVYFVSYRISSIELAAVQPLLCRGSSWLPLCYMAHMSHLSGRAPPNNAMDGDTVRAPLRAAHGARHRER